jgi:hypothetical protein
MHYVQCGFSLNNPYSPDEIGAYALKNVGSLHGKLTWQSQE